MTVVAPIDMGPMSPTGVGVDEVVGEDDNDVGDQLVLDEDEGCGQGTAATGVAAAGTKEEHDWWTCDDGYGVSSGGGRRRATTTAARLGARQRCSK